MLSHRGLEWLSRTGPLRRLTMSELLRSLPPRGHPCLDGSTLLLPRQGDALPKLLLLACIGVFISSIYIFLRNTVFKTEPAPPLTPQYLLQ